MWWQRKIYPRTKRETQLLQLIRNRWASHSFLPIFSARAHSPLPSPKQATTQSVTLQNKYRALWGILDAAIGEKNLLEFSIYYWHKTLIMVFQNTFAHFCITTSNQPTATKSENHAKLMYDCNPSLQHWLKTEMSSKRSLLNNYLC